MHLPACQCQESNAVYTSQLGGHTVRRLPLRSRMMQMTWRPRYWTNPGPASNVLQACNVPATLGMPDAQFGRLAGMLQPSMVTVGDPDVGSTRFATT